MRPRDPTLANSSFLLLLRPLHPPRTTDMPTTQPKDRIMLCTLCCCSTSCVVRCQARHVGCLVSASISRSRFLARFFRPSGSCATNYSGCCPPGRRAAGCPSTTICYRAHHRPIRQAFQIIQFVLGFNSKTVNVRQLSSASVTLLVLTR